MANVNSSPSFNRQRFFCGAVGCDAKCSRWTGPEMFCEKHWLMVPSDVKKMVEHAYRAEFVRLDRWSARFERAMQWAVEEIWSMQTAGHRVPKASDFDFTDDVTKSEE